MNGTVSKKPELTKGGKKASTYRRIVTGNANGRSVVQSDEQLQPYEFKSVPNYEHTLVSSAAMSSCKTVRVTRGETEAQLR